jgi:FAD/FMN-containing dehydrogenase
VSIDPGDLARLRGALSGSVEADPARLGPVASDASDVHGAPDARVVPEGVPDLVALVRWAIAHRTPLIARGAGTSLDGESVPTHGGVVVDFSRWDRILEIDPVDGIARVQPGVVNRVLDRRLGEFGLTYPPNPGSGESSTIGGNVATNASGPRSLRHGPTRSWIRALEVVDGTGALWTAGGRFAKSSVGPDLVGALVGSEGTLALFAEVTVRVAVRPARRTGIVLALPDGRPLGGFLAELRDLLGAGVSAIEYADAGTADVLGKVAGSGWPTGRGLLFVEVEGSEVEEGDLLARLDAACRRLGLPEDPRIYEDADRLWRIRGEAGPALERDGGHGLREDVAVPVSRLDELLGALQAIAERFGTTVRIFGHLGEGNLHPMFAVDPRSPRASELRDALCEVTLRLGGTISGEHGVGATKRRWLPVQLGEPSIAVLRALKSTLDPHGILNPGKLLPDLPPRDAEPPFGSPSPSATPRTLPR